MQGPLSQRGALMGTGVIDCEELAPVIEEREIQVPDPDRSSLPGGKILNPGHLNPSTQTRATSLA